MKWLRWIFTRRRNLATDDIVVELPPLGTRERVEQLGKQLDFLRHQRTEAMAAYQERLRSHG